ncbi:hypothetical protein AOLI_G00009320 [Acnodon oligacanthus]
MLKTRSHLIWVLQRFLPSCRSSSPRCLPELSPFAGGEMSQRGPRRSKGAVHHHRRHRELREPPAALPPPAPAAALPSVSVSDSQPLPTMRHETFARWDLLLLPAHPSSTMTPSRGFWD